MRDELWGGLGHLQVGDPVMVKTHTSTVEATVVKKGRLYFTARWNGSAREDEFSLKTGQYRYEGNLHAYSVEQYQANVRKGDVVKGLREMGLDLRVNHSLSLETLEKVLHVVKEEAG